MAPDYAMPVLQELLTHQDFVRRLARHLVRDEHRAADVVQEVWIRALEKPPRQRTSLQGWLARVTRTVASNTVRGERRRRHHEGKQARSEDSPRAESARRELALQHCVVEAVQALDEPYRATILLRYFEELSRTQIAAELDISVATVSTRLQRGLAKLRQRLDRAHGGDRGAWVRGLVLLLAKNAPPPVFTIGGGVLGGGTTLATLVTMAKLGAVLVLLAGAGWWLRGWFGGDSEPSGTEVVAESSSGAVTPPPANAGVESHEVGDGVSRHPVPVDSAPDEPPRRPGSSLVAGWALRGRVHGLPPEELARVRLVASSIPAAGGPISLPRPGNLTGSLDTMFDEEGYFEINLTEVIRAPTAFELAGFAVFGQHPDFAPFSTRVYPAGDELVITGPEDPSPPITWWVDVEFAPAAFLEGRVVHGLDQPAARGGAVAYRMRDGVPDLGASAAGPCAADGSFTLRVPYAGEWVVVGIDGRQVSGPAIARVALGERYVFAGPLVLSAVDSIKGRVIGFDRPPDNLRVAARLGGDHPHLFGANPGRYEGEDHELAWVDDGFVPAAPGRVRPAADGSFVFHGLGSGTYALVPVPPGLFVVVPGAPVGTEVEVGAPGDGVELVAPWATVRLQASPPLQTESWGLLTVIGATGSVSRGFAGRWGIPPLACAPGEGLHVRVECHGRETWEGTIVAPDVGKDVPESISLPRGGVFASLEVEVVVGDLEGLENLGLDLFAPDGDGHTPLIRGAAPVVDGVATFRGLPSGEFEVVLCSPLHGAWLIGTCDDRPCRITLEAGERTRQRVEFLRGGRMSFDVRDEEGTRLRPHVSVRNESGEEVDVHFVTYWQGQVPQHTKGQLAGGGPATTCVAFPPGQYEVEYELEGYVPKAIRATVSAATITTVDTVLARDTGDDR